MVAAVAAIAVLYSSVGHGGASGYLAVMALFGVSPGDMRPTALGLNILVSSLASYHFFRAGHFRWRLLWPFAVTSFPAAALGGAFTLPDPIYKRVVGVVLLVAAWHLIRSAIRTRREGHRPPSVPIALAVGAGLGLLAGLSGVGGGIFLSPLLLTAGWADARETAAVSAVFILVNSVAGLASSVAAVGEPPRFLGLLAVAAGAGGFVGARFGSRRLGGDAIRRLLALVLLIAGVKFLFLM